MDYNYYPCHWLLLNQAKTAERIRMKFGVEVAYILD